MVTTRTSADVNDWLNAIKTLAGTGVTWTEKSLGRKAPQFFFGGRCIASEKITRFKSIVLKWVDDSRPMPCEPPTSGRIYPCEERQNKKWQFRVKLMPWELADYLDSLPT